jgi:phosphatidylglycerophosphate synthase
MTQLTIVGASDTRLFGLSLKERLRRQFARAGFDSGNEGGAIIARADVAIDQPLIEMLTRQPKLVLLDEQGEPLAVHADDAAQANAIMNGGAVPSSYKAGAPKDLKATFWKVLRKREIPYAFRIMPGEERAAEWRVFMGTYKGATDIITKHLWPMPAFHACRWLAPLGVTPNMVTTVAAVLTALAFWLFLRGDYGAGLIAAWAMTFLDTVDGKLARTTLTSSKWGDIFDHGIDLVHPPFWYAAWAIGLAQWGVDWSPELFWWVMVAILGGYVLQRLIEGISIKWLGLEIHIWRRIDTLFRQITARRNPNLILLTIFTLMAKPDWGLIAVALWTAICLVLHGAQLLQAFAARKHGPLTSWMAA